MKYIIVLLTTVFLISGCYKDDNTQAQTGINCTEFKQNFIDNDKEAIRIIINSLCQNYPPISTQDDELGHKENTIKLIEELNGSCSDIVFVQKCYACLESYPPQSSIEVQLDSVGISIIRGFRLYVPENEKMYMQ